MNGKLHEWKSQKAYILHEDVSKSVDGSPHIQGVCPMCQQELSQVAKGFHCL